MAIFLFLLLPIDQFSPIASQDMPVQILVFAFVLFFALSPAKPIQERLG